MNVNYMEEKIPQLKKLQNVRMTDIEKARMRESLVRHMEQFPLASTNAASVRTPEKATPSPYAPLWGGAVFMRIMASALVLVLLVGSGTTFASAEALPGSFLYPIRVHVKEKVERALLRAPEKKLAYDQARLETRIGELEMLAENEDSEEEIETIVLAKAAFVENLSDFEATLKENERSGRIAASTKTREAVLNRLDAYSTVEAPVATMALMKMSAPAAAEADVAFSGKISEEKPVIEEKKTKAKESIRELLKVSRARILEAIPETSLENEMESENSVNQIELDTYQENEDSTSTSLRETSGNESEEPAATSAEIQASTPQIKRFSDQIKKTELGATVINLSE